MSQGFDFNQLLILTDDDLDFRQELLGSYVASFTGFPDEYAALMRSRKMDDLRFAIHSVKASVRMVGADELDRLLEQSARTASDGADVEPSITRVRQLCQMLIAEIGRL